MSAQAKGETGELRHRRVVLKLSGEALRGDAKFGIDVETLHSIGGEVASAHHLGAEVALVIGGGNIFRGLKGSAAGMDRASADYMGMLATVMNAVALQDALEKRGLPTRVLTALEIREIAEPYIRRRAIRHLEKGRVVIFAAGTGNPYFTTDTAAALRAMEIGASLLCKATKVDGVYDKDPMVHTDARMFKRLSYDHCLSDRLGVMDSTAISLCRDNSLPIRVFELMREGNVARVLRGEDVGTLVTHEGE